MCIFLHFKPKKRTSLALYSQTKPRCLYDLMSVAPYFMFIECTAGYYGNNCSNTCGNCANGASCNHVTGNCPGVIPRCRVGWKGEQCKSGKILNYIPNYKYYIPNYKFVHTKIHNYFQHNKPLHRNYVLLLNCLPHQINLEFFILK